MTRCTVEDVYEKIDVIKKGRVMLMLIVENLDEAKEAVAFIRKHSGFRRIVPERAGRRTLSVHIGDPARMLSPGAWVGGIPFLPLEADEYIIQYKRCGLYGIGLEDDIL